jgi:DNA-binding NtrC family response regulator
MKNVVVLDDDVSLVKTIQDILEGEGHKAFIAGDELDVATQFALLGKVDVFLTDFNIGKNKTSEDLIKAVIVDKPDTKVVLMSGNYHEASQVAEKYGVPFLEKPFRATVLFDVINS